ncbi:nucleoside-diphosphate kinase [Thiomicrospira sp. WB1]|uniref:nucleoside-diphosphate kinase n=1 Tax=Thiomicrospira sp. WB1 TaxID=1685380 RepID=UPI00074A6128|nr:nucleoside-diphosphate kinase [Thiomicrospira sp. WB1]KUJ71696.1 nucleoside-diphosphate kinase [Thiomicrospira sp. WB1]
MLEQTFAIIKPDAVKRNLIGEIIQRMEENNLAVIAAKMLQLTEAQAQGFYAEHQGKPFFETLVTNMTAGPIVVMVLEGDHAIEQYRRLMGTTDPEQAEPGTLRKLYAVSMQQNSVHGSDSPESAAREIGYFFSQLELHGANCAS